MTSIYQALAAVMADVDHVAKREINQQQRFVFRGVDAVVNAVGPALRKHKVLVVPDVRKYHYGEILVGKDRTPMGHARVVVAYTFYGPDGDFLITSTPGEAFDSGDKATAKAMSVAFRIALLQALALPTDEPDPDSQSYERAPIPVTSAPPLAAAKGRAWNAMKALHPDWPQDERQQATEMELAALGSSIAQADSAIWTALADELEHRVPA